ncbi:ATP synthase I chain [Andreesenia angusta]|uniref:ATP synthase I chain n=1 Tax=Andreesenia angusta TaxID=39480 RepID=A0A1S1V5J3_9FIRM|nr:ATP synthase subunit I [Andreesenia angusta]OHW61931.1 ATP synthase I chain [Andreesenia angusta]
MALGKNYVATIIKRTTALLLFGIGLSFFLAKEPMPYIYGFIFGGSISILGFKLLEQSAKKAANMNESGAKNYMTITYFIRYAIYGVMLVVSAKADYINLFTAIIALFLIKLVIVSDAVYDTIIGRRG